MNSEKRKEQNNQEPAGILLRKPLSAWRTGRRNELMRFSAGDKVLSVSGEDVRVMNIISGIEEKVVVLVTQSGKRIRLTSDHPVQTRQRGVQPVKALLVTDKVKTADGNFEEIDSLYTEMYNDRVYNLCLEKKVSSLVTALRWEISILSKIFRVLSPLPQFQKRRNMSLIS